MVGSGDVIQNQTTSNFNYKACSFLFRFLGYGLATRGGGVLDQWLGIGVPLRVSNPDPV